MYASDRVTSEPMGRRKKFDERCVASFVKGTFDRIDAVMKPSQDRTDFIREAVEKELERMEAAKAAKAAGDD